MKPQDAFFFLILLFIVWKKDSKLAVWIGLISLLFAIPLFATWTFFTAERLTWYAAAFFLLAIILHLRQLKK